MYVYLFYLLSLDAQYCVSNLPEEWDESPRSNKFTDSWPEKDLVSQVAIIGGGLSGSVRGERGGAVTCRDLWILSSIQLGRMME